MRCNSADNKQLRKIRDSLQNGETYPTDEYYEPMFEFQNQALTIAKSSLFCGGFQLETKIFLPNGVSLGLAAGKIYRGDVSKIRDAHVIQLLKKGVYVVTYRRDFNENPFLCFIQS